MLDASDRLIRYWKSSIARPA